MKKQGYKAKVSTEKVHHLSMKGAFYLDFIIEGKKLYEGRICTQKCEAMEIGELLELFDKEVGWGILCEITSLDRFESFEKMLQEKGVVTMLPQLEEKGKTLSQKELLKEGVKVYRAFPGGDREKSLGVVAIGVRYLKKITRSSMVVKN